ncbi:MAG TPA: SDR family NAD(P)-dependent oxidoreductase [Candidatus Baltobacteraceae bacterium]|nr:SDR family NAD(P)-dependent oxidoreductase [Candidatus Baltobacteraceae bacterium]
MNAHQTGGKPLAVVTGASSGIGFELAKQFAQNGFDLVIAAEDEGVRRAAQELEGMGASVRPVQADLATYEGVEQLYAEASQTGTIDAVAINAGIGVGGDFRVNDLRDELRMIDLNVTGAVHLAKRVVADMSARNSGRILFTSSIAALMPSPFEAVYGATKSFLYSFSEALRNELKDTGITVTALLPGPTDTNFFHRAGMDDTKAGQEKKDDPAQVARQGFEALMGGKDHVVAGSLKTKAQAAVISQLPQTVKGEIHRGLSEPEGAKK